MPGPFIFCGIEEEPEGGKDEGLDIRRKDEKLNLSFSTTLDQSPSPTGTGGR